MTIVHVSLGRVKLEIEGVYHPGMPESPPSYSSGGEPAEPPSFEITSVEVAGVDLTDLLDYLGPRTLEYLEDQAIKQCN